MKRNNKYNFWTNENKIAIARIIQAIVIMCILLSLIGCKSFYLKKAIQLNPDLFKDSVTIVEYEILDTSFILSSVDTITINNEGVTTEIIKNYHNYNFKQNIEPDTLKTITVVAKEPIHNNDEIRLYFFWTMILVSCSVFLFSVSSIIKNIKK